ncbi:hypothetical protein V8G54_027634, partial [Vigna mungo]
PVLGGGIWLGTRSNGTECLKFLLLPLIIIAVSIMVTSLAGLTGACYRNLLLMSLYLVAMILIMLVFLGFIIFAYAVTDKGSGRETENRAYLEYYLEDYEGWLKERVESDEYWTKISSCVKESKLCRKLGRTINGVPQTAETFYLRNLSPIQSGCCKPPTECGYKYENETMWSTEGVLGSNNTDCKKWNNDQNLLCYDCDSCKAGVLATLKKTWRRVSAGIHSSDSACSIPTKNCSINLLGNNQGNLRAYRTVLVPFVSKAIGHPLAKYASLVMCTVHNLIVSKQVDGIILVAIEQA